MVKRDELTNFVNETIGENLLGKALIRDEMANGVQINGSDSVAKVALGVSLNEEFLKKAVKWSSNYCIFHHGLDLSSYQMLLPDHLQKRLRLIFQYNLTIAGYHYALDAHQEIGNNAQIIKLLGAEIQSPLFEDWGFTAEFSRSKKLNEIKKACEKLFNHDIFAVSSGHQKIKTIGVVSGAGKPHPQHLYEMQQKNVELFITGESSEWLPHRFIETGINYFVCGHYATEVFGVKALGEKIQTHFGNKLQVKFIDVPNSL